MPIAAKWDLIVWHLERYGKIEEDDLERLVREDGIEMQAVGLGRRHTRLWSGRTSGDGAHAQPAQAGGCGAQ